MGHWIDTIPGGRAQVTDAYIASIAAALREFPRELALECAHPVRGLSRTTPFLPRIPEIVAWCSERVKDAARGEARARQREEQFRDRLPERRVGGSHRYPLFVEAINPRFIEMVERGKRDPANCEMVPEGIWVPLNWWHPNAHHVPFGFTQFTVDDLKRLYARNDPDTGQQFNPHWEG